MTPWSFIGWLLAALLCLLIGGVLYGSRIVAMSFCGPRS